MCAIASVKLSFKSSLYLFFLVFFSFTLATPPLSPLSPFSPQTTDNSNLQVSVLSLPYPIVIIDKDMIVVDMSYSYAELRNINREDVIGMSLWDYAKGVFSTELEKTFKEILYSQRPGMIETLVGDIMWKAKLLPMKLKDEIFISVQLFNPVDAPFIDQHTPELFRLLVENIKDYAVFMLNKNGVIITWNDGSRRMKGYTEGEIIGQHFKIFSPSGFHWEHVLEVASKGKYVIEDWKVRKDGTQFWSDTLISPIFTDGTLTGFSMVVKDLTTQLQAETAKENFLALIHHEHRNLLNSIVIGIDLIKNEVVEPDLLELVNLVHDSSQTLMSMINDLLDLAKFHNGFNLQTIVQTVDCRALIEDLGKQYQLLHQSNKEISIYYVIEDSVPQYIKIDPFRLQQVLRNLIGNALKFTERGNIKMKMSSEDCLEPGKAKIKFDVSDTGCGIKESDYDKIFQSFTQIDSGNTKRKQGTGIGLIIAQKIVEKMGGEITFESKENVGTTFSFSIFVDHVRPSIELERRASSSSTTRDYSIEDIHVLIAEDNRVNSKLLNRILVSKGITHIDSAFDGKQAMMLFDRNHYHIIFSDISMPEFDGYQVTEYIRTKNTHIPIIAITGNATPKDQEKCLQYGMTSVLTKPINMKKLDHLLKTYL